MSVRSAFGGRVNSATVSSMILSAPLHQSRSQMASKQLARLHSTAVRPSQRAVPRVSFLPQVRSSQSALGHLTGRRAQSTSAASKDEAKLDWNSFFKLRASRRRYSLASSIVTSLVSTAVGVQFLSTQDLESIGAQVMGLDPFVVLGLATAACGAVGWLAGPIVGNGTWGLVYRRFKPSFATVSTKSARPQREIMTLTVIPLQKEKEFFDRIRRFRVDPSTNSIANPVPDYYGEKIGSVQGYRQWLKDQRAYNRKRRNFIT